MIQIHIILFYVSNVLFYLFKVYISTHEVKQKEVMQLKSSVGVQKMASNIGCVLIRGTDRGARTDFSGYLGEIMNAIQKNASLPAYQIYRNIINTNPKLLIRCVNIQKNNIKFMYNINLQIYIINIIIQLIDNALKKVNRFIRYKYI